LRRAPCQFPGLAILALAGALGLAGASAAQEAPGAARGLRYLSWPSRSAAAEPPTVASAEAGGARLRRPNRVIPHGGAAPAPRETLTAAPGPVRRTLTPASAWLRPAPPPAAAQPIPAPAPAPARAPAPAPVAEQPAPPPAAPVPEYVPDAGGQPAPASVAYPAPPQPPAADDPMAPRRDAPIFRMQRPEPAPPPIAERDAPAEQPAAEASPAPRRVATVTTNPADRPSLEGARYYSVHRQNGRAPDALALPQPTYVDALAITMNEAPTTPDLAAPDPGPTLIRDAQGRLRAQPAAPEGDYQ